MVLNDATAVVDVIACTLWLFDGILAGDYFAGVFITFATAYLWIESNLDVTGVFGMLLLSALIYEYIKDDLD